MQYKTRLDFIRRHHKFFTVLGAAIVFLTFMVKEGLRESAKDQLERIESARSEVRLRDEHAEVLERIEDSRLEIGDLIEKNPRPEMIDKNTEYGQWRSVRDEVALDTLGEFLWNSAQLLRTLSRKDTLVAQGFAAGAEFRKAVSLQNQFNAAFASVNSDPKRRVATIEQKSFAKSLLDQWNKAADVDEAFMTACLSQARAEQETREREYQDFTEMSYALFGLGWAVGLLGKFVEPSSGGSDEDE